MDSNDHIVINGEGISNGRLAKPLIDQFDKDVDNDNCPYCKSNILLADKQYCFNDSNDPNDLYAQLTLWHCPDCSFWKLFKFTWNYDSHVSSIYHQLYSSKLKEFNDSLPEFFKEEISIHLKRNPQLWNTFNHSKFEKYVAELFKANFDYSEVLHVGGPNDLGIDLFYINSKEEEWLVQVKRRENSRKSEPVSTVIHLLGSLTIKNKKRGIIVSTADRYTSNAIKLVKSMKQKDYLIELIDLGILKRMINTLIPKDLPLKFLKSKQEDIELFKMNFPKEYKTFIREYRQYYS